MSGGFWTDRAVREALDLGGPDRSVATFAGVSTDTRTLGPGDLFVALVGERFDGHDYLADAARMGATGAVVEAERVTPGAAAPALAYEVPDTLVALGRLARFRRRALDAKVVGITGSSGKTTTKDLLTGALSESLRTHATRGNFNNRVGLPLTVVAAPDDAEVLVLEMGTNEPGEIAALSEIAEPDIGVITTVSETHLEKLGSVEGVLEEKTALLERLPGEGTAFVGELPPALPERARRAAPHVRVAGLGDGADPGLRPAGLEVGHRGCYRFRWRGQPVRLRIPGKVAVVDALLALGVADALGVSAKRAASGVSGVEPGAMRGQVREVGRLTFLVDCYNANPESVVAAVQTLTDMPSPERRIAVLGSMLELGPEAAAIHARVLAQVLRADLDAVLLTGQFADVAEHVPDDRVERMDNVAAAASRLLELARDGDTVLLKASRGVRLERVLEAFEPHAGTAEEVS